MLTMAASGGGCSRSAEAPVEQTREVVTVAALEARCRDIVGEPRIETVAGRVFVAIGYDLANIAMIHTDAGNVIIDTGMSPERSEPAKQALISKAPGEIVAVILTHSHIDHIGGANVFAGPDTPIWGSESLAFNFLRQYGEFAKAELSRGARQFGQRVSKDALPCSSLGRRPDVEGAAKTGAMLPTDTFTGSTEFKVGDLTFELVEAHGETTDQIFVHIPELHVVFPGDNYYAAYPNLYSIRGTTPRPVNDWIRSLDAIRRRAPEYLVPAHTTPVRGKSEVELALTRYRDGIQWVRDRVVQGANDGLSVDQIAESVGLPKSLAEDPALVELYGQLDWAARAIYTNRLGWFDGRPESLYPLARREQAARTISMMGGPGPVTDAAREAIAGQDRRWALELLALVRDAQGLDAEQTELMAAALEALGLSIANTNGRAYLLQSAIELREGVNPLNDVREDTPLLDATPLSYFFSVMSTRLDPARAGGVYESVQVHFTDVDQRFVITVRNGVAEVIEGDPLPGTPEPVAIATTDGATWRRMAIGLTSPMKAVATGRFKVEGSSLAFKAFVGRFRKGL